MKVQKQPLEIVVYISLQVEKVSHGGEKWNT